MSKPAIIHVEERISHCDAITPVRLGDTRIVINEPGAAISGPVIVDYEEQASTRRALSFEQ